MRARGSCGAASAAAERAARAASSASRPRAEGTLSRAGRLDAVVDNMGMDSSPRLESRAPVRWARHLAEAGLQGEAAVHLQVCAWLRPGGHSDLRPAAGVKMLRGRAGLAGSRSRGWRGKG
eukprot:3578798-Prymnesium_polylepis.1